MVTRYGRVTGLTALAVAAAALGAAALGGCGSSASSAIAKPVALRVARSSTFDATIYQPVPGFGDMWVVGVNSLLRLDPATFATLASIALPGSYPSVGVGASGVWVGVLGPDREQGVVARIDPATNRITATIPLGIGEPSDVAVTTQGVLVETDLNGSTVYRIDPQTDRASVDTGASLPAAPVEVDGGYWSGKDAPELVGPNANCSVVRTDATTNAKTSFIIPGQQSVYDFTSAYGRLWAMSYGNSIELIQIDPLSRQLDGPPMRLAGSPDLGPTLSAAYGGLWTVTNGNTLTDYVPQS